MSETARQLRAWMTAVMGAVMAGWGLTLTILVANAFQSRQAWVWWAVATGLAVWFALDTGRSIYHRVYANAALNTVLLVLAAIPLIGTIGEFHCNGPASSPAAAEAPRKPVCSRGRVTERLGRPPYSVYPS